MPMLISDSCRNFGEYIDFLCSTHDPRVIVEGLGIENTPQLNEIRRGIFLPKEFQVVNLGHKLDFGFDLLKSVMALLRRSKH